MGLLRVKPVLQTWGRTLRGRVPSLSIEITRECPLHCPGCYAYQDGNLGTTNLRSLADFRGQELLTRVLDLIDEHKPLHLSIVGGDPLVRYRELEILLPQLVRRAHVQVVTSAFRPIPLSWARLPNLQLVVSIDGLQPEHDLRRKPATYGRILRNIRGHHVVETLLRIRQDQRKLDMPEGMIKEFLSPPTSPKRCIFAQTTLTLSADLTTRVEPCQFGGDPDCSRCGCMASMGLAAVGHRKLVGSITAGHIFWTSTAIGRHLQRAENMLRQLVTRKQCKQGGEGHPGVSLNHLKVID